MEKLGEYLRYEDGHVGLVMGACTASTMTHEEAEKVRAENLIREREQRDRLFACVVVDAVQTMITTRDITLPDATERALEMVNWARDFVKTFKLAQK